ncbi:cytochrome aa3 quinol oxidase subunit II [Alicyclobacillaceae bacterium I2511]|nr:cytochrome aa3 quinol oxidase subunit II [Alicyclobacillaceae bacterium I2511]
MPKVRPRKKSTKLGLAVIASLLLLTGCGQRITVLNPQGPVARQEYHLIILSIVIMSFVLAVVMTIFIYVLVKFRARPGKDPEGYNPELAGYGKLEIIWTVVPILMMIALAVPTVKMIYRLQHPPTPTGDPMTIQVTSVDWKWIFEYPQQGIETVNYVAIPAGIPVDFKLSAVGPMNSFWVPALGGQEYAMPGMNMPLWLEASNPGTYLGWGANFTGAGFADMHFNVLSKSQNAFNQWVSNVKQTAPKLTEVTYRKLLQPGEVPTMTFSSMDSQFTQMNAEMSSLSQTIPGKQ